MLYQQSPVVYQVAARALHVIADVLEGFRQIVVRHRRAFGARIWFEIAVTRFDIAVV